VSKVLARFVAGIDEAGRGPVIGPLVLAGVLFPEEKLQDLVAMGTKDSKKLSPKRRFELSALIESAAKQFVCIEVSPEEIDGRINRGISLNHLEAEKIAQIIMALHPDQVYVDCPDANPARFTELLRNLVASEEISITAMHFADESIPVVSAASIIAKVRRDLRVKELSDKLGDIGSGYPSDPKTKKYLKKLLRGGERQVDTTKFLRSTWKTVRKTDKRKV
jgi:ribonuclease HII